MSFVNISKVGNNNENCSRILYFIFGCTLRTLVLFDFGDTIVPIKMDEFYFSMSHFEVGSKGCGLQAQKRDNSLFGYS